MKQLQCLPIVTDNGVYTLRVHADMKLKQPKYHITVVDGMDDLVICESYFTYDVVKCRMADIANELLG